MSKLNAGTLSPEVWWYSGLFSIDKCNVFVTSNLHPPHLAVEIVLIKSLPAHLQEQMLLQPISWCLQLDGGCLSLKASPEVLLEPGQETLPNFLAENRVDVIASLPSYEADQTDRSQHGGTNVVCSWVKIPCVLFFLDFFGWMGHGKKDRMLFFFLFLEGSEGKNVWRSSLGIGVVLYLNLMYYWHCEFLRNLLPIGVLTDIVSSNKSWSYHVLTDIANSWNKKTPGPI